MGKYDDIIGRRYEGVTSHTRMSLEARAAQFAPFAALSGHDAAIGETARLTSKMIELSADEQRMLSERLCVALAHIAERSVLTFTLFQPDALIQGGRYVSVSGIIKKYDEYEKSITLTTGQTLPVADIISIDGEFFQKL